MPLFGLVLSHDPISIRRILDPRKEWSFITSILQNLYNLPSVTRCIQRCAARKGSKGLVLTLASVFDQLQAPLDKSVNIKENLIKDIKSMGFNFERNSEVITFFQWLLAELNCPCLTRLFRTVVEVQTHFHGFLFQTEEYRLPSMYFYFTSKDRHLDNRLTEAFSQVSGQPIERPEDPHIAAELTRLGALFDGTLQPVSKTVTIHGAQILFVHFEREQPRHPIEFHEYMSYGSRRYFLKGMIIRDDKSVSERKTKGEKGGSEASGNHHVSQYAVIRRRNLWLRIDGERIETFAPGTDLITMYQRSVISLFYADLSEKQDHQPETELELEPDSEAEQQPQPHTLTHPPSSPTAETNDPPQRLVPLNFRLWFLVPLAAVSSFLISLAIISYILFL